MQKLVKKRVLDLCESIMSIHGECTKLSDMNDVISYFSMCQDGAVAIGETLEKETGNYESAIGFLENYCEDLFHLAQKQDFDTSVFQKLADSFFDFSNEIKKIPHKLEVAFFPYQSAMWDSLESVYFAFMQKEECHCSVVPIPYSVYKKNEDVWQPAYDGYKMPLDIPIVKYDEYDLEAMRPDIAFIHNPYDEHNFITRVDAKFYASNLKEYVDTLVYIPYYVNFMTKKPKKMEYFPAYQYADYCIFQSKISKEYLQEVPFYDKILPLGSPKLDKVIRYQKEGGYIPKEWEEILTGKKKIMLNVTVGLFLTNGMQLLDKLLYLFREIKEQNEVALIWRPHPLIEQTIDSMKPELQQKYAEVMEYFLENKIGVLDKTPDITNTVAISDAYVGDGASSVVTLFLVANKPIFVYNEIDHFKEYSIDEKTRIELALIQKVGDKIIATALFHAGIFEISSDFKEMKYLGCDPEDNAWGAINKQFAIENQKIYLSSHMSKKISYYDVETNTFHTIVDQNDYLYDRILIYKEKLIYFGIVEHTITIHDRKQNTWETYALDLTSIQAKKNDVIYESISNRCRLKNKLYFCMSYSNQLLVFDLDTYTQEYISVGKDVFGYVAMLALDDTIWLSEKTGNIVKYNTQTNEVDIIPPPQGVIVLPKIQNRRRVYLGAKNMGKYIVVSPGFSTAFLRINQETMETKLIGEEALYPEWESVRQGGKRFDAVAKNGLVFDENHIICFMPTTFAYVKLNIETEEYEIIDLKLKEADYERLMKDLDKDTFGFEKKKNTDLFCKIENKHHSFRDFCSDLASGKLEVLKPIQQKYAEEIAENIDGTSGEAICEEILKRYKQAKNQRI